MPERFRRGTDLNPPDPDTFYTPGPEGYIDYPALEAGIPEAIANDCRCYPSGSPASVKPA